MATLTVRNLYDDLKSILRVQAARHGQSMEEEVRSILRQALTQATLATGLGQRLASRFQAYARIGAVCARLGRPISAEDAQIAALALGTRNERDFELIDSLSVVNPWIAAS